MLLSASLDTLSDEHCTLFRLMQFSSWTSLRKDVLLTSSLLSFLLFRHLIFLQYLTAAKYALTSEG